MGTSTVLLWATNLRAKKHIMSGHVVVMLESSIAMGHCSFATNVLPQNITVVLGSVHGLTMGDEFRVCNHTNVPTNETTSMHLVASRI